MTLDGRDALEERQRLLDGHVEDLGDRLALVEDLERLAVVAPALADLARHVDVREELHVDLDRAVTRAGFAAAALDVEGEAAGLVTAHLGLGGRGEQLAHVVEQARVGGRVRPGRPPDGRLVDADELVDQVEAVDALVLARHCPTAVDVAHEDGAEDVVHQRGLA